MHGPVAADYFLRSLHLPHVEDRFAMVIIRQPRFHFLRSVAVIVKWPKLHRFVFTARQEVILPRQRRQTLCCARVTDEALQANLVKVEMRILLVQANFILPVRQPVALQGAAAARQLLLQSTVL